MKNCRICEKYMVKKMKKMCNTTKRYLRKLKMKLQMYAKEILS